jgi:hypothetical protein
MKTTISNQGRQYEVNVTEWTGRPKANGIYVMVKNPVYGEIMNIIKNEIETAFNLRLLPVVSMPKSIGFFIDNSDKTLSPSIIMMALRKL